MKNKTSNLLEGLGVFTAFTGIIGLLVFSPVITFGFAFFGGLILKWIVGGSIAYGFNTLFNTARFTPDLIPITCATLATVGKYFKSSQTNNNK